MEGGGNFHGGDHGAQGQPAARNPHAVDFLKFEE
jgi:hypothetical protein